MIKYINELKCQVRYFNMKLYTLFVHINVLLNICEVFLKFQKHVKFKFYQSSYIYNAKLCFKIV